MFKLVYYNFAEQNSLCVTLCEIIKCCYSSLVFQELEKSVYSVSKKNCREAALFQEVTKAFPYSQLTVSYLRRPKIILYVTSLERLPGKKQGSVSE